MKIAAWNVNHRATRKKIPENIAHAIISTDADMLVFCEFVHSDITDDRQNFYNQLESAGYTFRIFSTLTPKENHILIASRIAIVAGDLKAPTTIQSAVPSNFLHVRCVESSTEIIGLRVPDYSKATYKEVAQAYWTWFSSLTKEMTDRSVIIIGDFNIDPAMKKYRFRKHLTDLLDNGWQIASPNEGASYYAHNNNAPHRLDHAFLTGCVKIISSSYIQEVDGLWKCGEDKYKEPDHAILVVEVVNA